MPKDSHRDRHGLRHSRRGNIVASRLDEALNESGWGSLSMLLARINSLQGNAGYEDIGNLTQDALSRIRHDDRVVYDYELIAIAEALDVSVYWLVGLTDDRRRPEGIRRLYGGQ